MNYTDLAPIIAIDAIGAPTPLIVRKIAEAAHEFFRKTRGYTYTQTLNPVPANTKSVALTPPVGTVFIETVLVRLNGQTLPPPMNLQLNGDWESIKGRPASYLPAVGAIRLFPYPETQIDEALTIEFALAPLLTATSIDDSVGLANQDALIAGAKARVLSMPRKEWADPIAARSEELRFKELINERRLLARNNGTAQALYRIKSRFV